MGMAPRGTGSARPWPAMRVSMGRQPAPVHLQTCRHGFAAAVADDKLFFIAGSGRCGGGMMADTWSYRCGERGVLVARSD